jgi:hypothetical protein
VKQKLPASAEMARDPGSTTRDVDHSSRNFDGSAFCTVTGVCKFHNVGLFSHKKVLDQD